MPTRDRRAFVPRAVDCFRRQDHPARELVIVDDGDDSIADLAHSLAGHDPVITYHRLPHPLPLGAKRNLAISLARGEVIAHWDDDDWSAPHRLRTQVASLLTTGAEICGAGALYFHDPDTRRAWRYHYRPPAGAWVAGTSLCYTRATWERDPFPATQVGEDSQFVLARDPGKVVDVSEADCVVATLHPQNSAFKDVGGRGWTAVPLGTVERLLNADRSE